MKNDQSTFIKELGYLIDQFDELQDLRWSDLQYLAEYRELKMKKNDGLPIDQVRLDQLELAFKNKIVTASRWNKFQNALVGMQTFIKTEVEGFIIEKQIEITNYVDLKKVEVVTVVEDGKTAINTTKDNALISIENKKDNIMDYMDGTTAGAIRNDIGVMGDSTIDGRSLIEKTNNLKLDIKNLAGEGRTNETVKSAHDLAQQAFQSASDGKTVIASSITAKGVPATKEDTFPTLASKINAIETDKTGDATALSSDILAPKTAYAKGKKLIGTIPSKGVATITPGITPILIEAGQYLSGRQTIAGVAVPVANVLVGTTIAGQAGTMPNRGAVTHTITTQGGSFVIPKDYHNGAGKVTASFLNLVEENIKEGVNIGNVVGTLKLKNIAVVSESISGSATKRITVGFRVKAVIALGNATAYEAQICNYSNGELYPSINTGTSYSNGGTQKNTPIESSMIDDTGFTMRGAPGTTVSYRVICLG